mmetsp:Transcript_83919/g.136042  ORF Transcript_83919/g.136042 Transcript_83919/m.136042 type:complete len:96 (-) Transcript_83919:488-775(-)
MGLRCLCESKGEVGEQGRTAAHVARFTAVSCVGVVVAPLCCGCCGSGGNCGCVAVCGGCAAVFVAVCVGGLPMFNCAPTAEAKSSAPSCSCFCTT